MLRILQKVVSLLLSMKHLHSYQSKIFLSFLSLAMLLGCWAFFNYKIDVRNNRLEILSKQVNDLETEYLTQTRHLQNFLLYGFHQSDFYTLGKQPDIDTFEAYLKNNYVKIETIQNLIEHDGINVTATINTLFDSNEKLIHFIADLKAIYKAKGYKDFGTEGKMRYYAHLLEDSSLIPEINILQLRRFEKDFLLRGEAHYSEGFLLLVNKFILQNKNKPHTLEILNNYKYNFEALVKYNNKIGIYASEGLYNVIQNQLTGLNEKYLQLSTQTTNAVLNGKVKNNYFLYTGTAIFLILVIVSIWRLSKYLSKEIKQLNEIIVNYINAGFKEETSKDIFSPKILEVHTINRSFTLLKYKLKNMLKEKEIHQKMLVSAVIDGQEKERKNIGAELHDNINPLMATAKMYLCVGRDSEKDRELMILKSIEIITASLNEVRKLSHSLVGAPTEEFYLQESLKELISSIELGADFKITFSSENFDEKNISENKKLTLYRIVQEQLTNVVKYSHAEDVVVSLNEKQDNLLLCIKDNGVGFDKNLKTKGIGFRNIETRLELVNGSMYLNSSPGKGCEMIVSVPVFNV
jgi:signal transduction histidine kinase